MDYRGVENQVIHLQSLPKSKSVDITSNKILEKIAIKSTCGSSIAKPLMEIIE